MNAYKYGKELKTETEMGVMCNVIVFRLYLTLYSVPQKSDWLGYSGQKPGCHTQGQTTAYLSHWTSTV